MKILGFPFHPFLFAAYPILFLFAHNLAITSFHDVAPPVLVSTLCAFFLWVVSSLVLRDKQKAGILVTVFVGFFFSYGRIFGANIPLVFVWFALFCLSAYLVIRIRRNLYNATAVLNVAAACLTIIPLVSIGAHALTEWHELQAAAEAEAAPQGLPDTVKKGEVPDIYYIILDSYASMKTLKEVYRYDNSQFINGLKKRGFYVPAASCSNYGWTKLTLASVLNMEYLAFQSDPATGRPADDQFPYKMINDSKVERFLKSRGYRCVHLGSGYLPREVNHGVGEFPVTLLKTTMVARAANHLVAYGIRNRILGLFNRLEELSKEPGPKFVFAHVLPPHWPYVFGPNGEAKGVLEMITDAASKKDEERYVDQVIFVNKKVEALVDAIQANSKRPPIIVLQGDHGPDCHMDWRKPSEQAIGERMRVFCAYYLPENGQRRLYDRVTPVNAFRAIFSLYFNAEHEFLRDESHFSTLQRQFDFVNVTDRVKY